MNGFKEVCFDKFTKKLEKNIKNYEARLNAWQNVKRVYKKDGTDYKNISQNFEGCKFLKDFRNEFECCVNYINYNGETCTDIISLHQTTENLPFEPKKDQEILGGCGWKPYIILDADQLEIMINNLIKNYQNYLEEAKKEYQKGVELFPQFWNKLDDLAKFIYENTENKNQISLNYAFIDVIKEQFNIN